MKIVNCLVCNKEQKISNARSATYKTCSKECLGIYIKSKNKLNCICTNCKKEFHLKESAIKRYNRNIGTFCSIKCSSEYKKNYYKGKNNPNFRGVQYDSDGYRINHYPKIGRIKEHHYVAFKELNINKLPKGYCIHHRDCNIYNNSPENLVLLSTSDHRWLHKQFGNATLWAFMNNKISYEELESWTNNKEKVKILKLNVKNQKK